MDNRKDILIAVMEMIVSMTKVDSTTVTVKGETGARLELKEAAEVSQMLGMIGRELLKKSMSAAGMLGHVCSDTGKEGFRDAILGLSDDIHAHSLKCVESMETGVSASHNVIIQEENNE